MSRNTIFHKQNISLVTGNDHALGKFIQIFDSNLKNETPEQEGLVFDFSELFGLDINLTGIPSNYPIKTIINTYIKDNIDDDTLFNPMEIEYKF